MRTPLFLVLLACAVTAAAAREPFRREHLITGESGFAAEPAPVGDGAEPDPPVWPKSFEARYTLTLPYVTALQTGGLHMPVRVVYDAGSEPQAGAGRSGSGSADQGGGERAPPQQQQQWRYRGERLRLELYDGQDVTVTAQGVVYSAYPRVNATACDQMAEPAGPTTAGGAGGGNGLPSLAPFPVVSRPHWHYAGRALVPAFSPRPHRGGGGSGGSSGDFRPQQLREALVWSNTTRHAEGAKTSSYQFYVDAKTGLPLRFYMVGFNILASSHYDEYLLDFESFEARDFDKEDGGDDDNPFAIPDACPRASAAASAAQTENNNNSRTFAGVAAQAAAAMPWSVPRAEAALGEQAAASWSSSPSSLLLLPGVSGKASSSAARPPLSPQPVADLEAPLSTRRALARRHALAYIDEWNGRREEELRALLGGRRATNGGDASGSGSNGPLASSSSSSSLVRPLLRMNHLASLTQEEYAATMTGGAGGLAERQRRAARAAAGEAGGDEDALARADALPSHLRRYHLGTLVPSYEIDGDGDDDDDDSAGGRSSSSSGRHHRRRHHRHRFFRRRGGKKRPLPREVDWRGTAADPGAPSDQGTCGSCWAFAAAGAMSGAWAVATGAVRPLSQQQMVDCAWRTGNNGCGGGWAERAIAYVADEQVSGGAVGDEFYPYVNVNAWCGDREAWPLNRGRTPARGGSWAGGGVEGEGAAANATTAATAFEEQQGQQQAGAAAQNDADADADGPPQGVARFRGVAAVRPHDDAALMDAVSRHGPVAVSIDASPLSFKFFGGGVYWSPECGWRPRDLDHAVLVVGYGTTAEGVDYWLVRNSWSALWGDSGYIRVKRGPFVDCGITTSPFIAVVSGEAASTALDRAPLVEGWAAPVVAIAAGPAAGGVAPGGPREGQH